MYGRKENRRERLISSSLLTGIDNLWICSPPCCHQPSWEAGKKGRECAECCCASLKGMEYLTHAGSEEQLVQLKSGGPYYSMTEEFSILRLPS
ncbi:hypothetical protein SUGI_0653560 [Cryptomeria japonica]|nr:hypothetical protein SUGI_0653560 [Cryptomeria japonica]